MHRDRTVNLETIYEAESGATFMTGIQALVRLPLMQRRFDARRGLKTAGLISGYRGSPIGAYDLQLWRAKAFLDAHDITFQPGLNEELAATALWGAQMHKAFGPTRVDGVFGIWYGKGNGVDRTGDAFRNANMLGTSSLGGVLAVAGDDHAAQSSMFPHQTDGIFQSVNMPVLQPANVSEILTLGMAGIAMSRFSGLWVGMKTIAEVVESAASFDLPDGFPDYDDPASLVPAHGLNWDPAIQWPDQRTEYERRLIEERLPAAVGWAAANRIDQVISASQRKAITIVTVGKAHQDLMEALEKLGIGEKESEALGISIYKVGMSWPLATEPLLSFAAGSSEIFVVEEKNPTAENQIKSAMFNMAGPRPKVTGKTDSDGKPLLPVVMEFTPLMVAKALVKRLGHDPVGIRERLERWESKANHAEAIRFPVRKPFFCAGCPHNSSTKTPEGSITGGGIGCHVMALSVPKLKTTTFSQMGGEGLQWVGAAPFSRTDHIFQNLGDGTYQHSGVLAVRAAVAAGTNITYKILFNDAVAMTGGQPAEGSPDPVRIVAQLLAEGVKSVRFVSDQPEKWANLPGEVQISHRDDMDKVQREMRDIAGVTAIVYEQTCAAEKRRRRKRATFPDPPRRLFINSRVCEGCGDCSVQSNCIAVQPTKTAEGVKRRIDQSACNKDYSCLKGFCPSFVEIEGAILRQPDGSRIASIEADRFASLPSPEIPALDGVFNVYVAGIGGLGVLTIGSLLGVAAHIAGNTTTVLDFTGLSQKNGAVVSQVRMAPAQQTIHAVRPEAGEADLVLGTDAVVASSLDAMRKFASGRGAIVLNSDETPTADAVTDRDATLPMASMIETLMGRAGKRGFTIKATSLAEGLFGNNVAANTLLVGYAWQLGLLPISAEAIDAAIEANGAAVQLNRRAFAWGRLAAIDLNLVKQVAGLQEETPLVEDMVDAQIARHARDLVAYQDQGYGQRYSDFMARVLEASKARGADQDAFVRSVARNAYRLMAYKDEYEVSRLYSEPAFRAALAEQFSGSKRISVYLAPPFLSGASDGNGRPRKRKFGPWIFSVFKLLARGKILRGTWLDPFGRNKERVAERALRDQYLTDIETHLDLARSPNADILVTLARLPDDIRGYGPVKDDALATYATRRKALLDDLAYRKTLRKAA